MSANFVEASESIYQNKLFPTVEADQDSATWYPNPVVDSKYELILLIWAAAFPFFAIAIKNRNISRLAKDIKSGMIICFAVPVLNNSMMCIIQLFWAGKYRRFEIVTAVISLFIIIIYVFELLAMYKPHDYEAVYFNSETGLIDFDCHFRVQINTVLRKAEVWLLIFIPTITWLISNFKLGSPIILLSIYLAIAVINFLKARAHIKFRNDIVFFNYFKAADNALRVFLIFLKCLYWARDIKNAGNKVLTWFYFIFLLIDIIIILGVYVCRIVFEIRKAYNWKEASSMYPERPRDLLDASKALKSIGKGNYKIEIRKGEYTKLNMPKNASLNSVAPSDISTPTKKGLEDNQLKPE